jgi:hypothetical protein
MYEYYNPNFVRTNAGDCVIRAISRAERKSWKTIYIALCFEGFCLWDLPNANNVWDSYLHHKGYKRYIIPDTCPDCYTVKQFTREHKTGTYILATGEHAIAVIDGVYYDSWDSGESVPVYYYAKER